MLHAWERVYFAWEWCSIRHYEEEPGRTWIDVSGTDKKGDFGLALFTEGKCGYSAKDGELRVTVFHSTAWSHHNPAVVTEADGYRLMEQGIHEFRYMAFPHGGVWRNANLPRRSLEFASPPLALVTDLHEGSLPAARSLASSDIENLNMTVIKLSEDGEGRVVRCVESMGRNAEGTLDLPLLGSSIEIDMSPWEIATFYLPGGKGKRAVRVNLLELE